MNDAWPLLKPLEQSEWGVIFAMQHYDLPTRLLDWTESFACAMYFAHRNRSETGTAAIWALDPEAMNQITIGVHFLATIDPMPSEVKNIDLDMRDYHPRYKSLDQDFSKLLPSIAIAPPFTNTRMTAQRAAFTLMGDSFLDIDAQCGGRLSKGGHLLKIELGPETYGETEDFLRLAGCTPFAFFPDLDGLAQRHKDETDAELKYAQQYSTET
jgi:hypothetical protein